MLDYNETVLLITGCMSPSTKVYKLTISNTEERRSQYLASLYYYIRNTKINKIVYCDNSNALSDQRVIDEAIRYGKKLEWLSFHGDEEKSSTQGKGYGEAEIVKYALEHSELLSNAKYFIKITGRLLVKNLDFISKFSKKNSIYFHPVITLTNRFYINTRIYMMPISIYLDYFFDIGDLVNDSKEVYLEHAFGMLIQNEKLKYKKFCVVPWIEGKSGSTGVDYNPNLYSYFKDSIKLWLYDTKRSYF